MRVLLLREQLEGFQRVGSRTEFSCGGEDQVGRLDRATVAFDTLTYSADRRVLPSLRHRRGSPGSLRMVRSERTIDVEPTNWSKEPRDFVRASIRQLQTRSCGMRVVGLQCEHRGSFNTGCSSIV